MTEARTAAELELRDYLSVVWRRKWTVLVPILVVVAVAIGSSVTQTSMYRADAQVLVRQPPTASSVGNTGGTLNPRQLANALSIAQSGELRRVVQAGLGGGPGLSVRSVGSSDVFVFSAVSSDPALAAEAANAYAAAFVAERRDSVIAEYQVSGAVLEERIAEIDPEVAKLQAERTQAEAAVPADAPDREAQLQSIANQFGGATSTLLGQRSRYASELESLKISTELARTSGTQVIDPATRPSSPFEPNITSAALTALAVGLVLGVSLAFLLEHFDTSLRTEEDMRLASGLPNLAIVPRLEGWKTGDTPHLITREHPHSPSAESYRGLRTALQFLGIDQRLRTVQLTSPRPGDGKSTTAANLAVAVARAGQRVVLVDCDLRKPRIHEFFGLGNDQGFTTVLLGDAEISDVANRIEGEPNLRVLTSGPVPPDPSELLSGARARSVLADLSDHVDLVVIDSPPVLAVADPLVISSMADGVVIVASAGGTDRRQVSRAVEQLRQVDAPVIGTVLNQFTARKVGGYGYYGGYGSYGSYEADEVGGPTPGPDTGGMAETGSDAPASRRDGRRATRATR